MIQTVDQWRSLHSELLETITLKTATWGAKHVDDYYIKNYIYKSKSNCQFI